jgi:hypothetical protein
MSVPAAAPVDRVRGVAAGLLTATLAVAAHGAGGGPLPSGAVAALLAVVAVTAGALATSVSRARSPWYLLGLLAAGQLLGHVLFSAAGHHHTDPAAPPGAAMFAAHLVAIVVGATLISAGDRLWRAVSRTVRAIVRVVCAVVARPAAAARSADQPLRSALMLAASVSHRGPPVGFAR